MRSFKGRIGSAVQALVDKFENDQRFRDHVSQVFSTLVSITIRAIRKR